MSTPLGSSQLFKTASFYPHEIDQSLRFNDGDSPYLHFTPSSDGNKDNWTFSCWAKRADLPGSSMYLLGASIATNKWFHIGFSGQNQLDIRQFNSSSYDFRKITTAVFRDVSSWYHIVVSYESGNATDEDRIKLYVNGDRITSFGTNSNPSSGLDAYVTQNHKHVIGAFTNNDGSTVSNYFDGYVAEVHLIDGTALDADNFGETKGGIWVPKAYSGSYGTNGFYLDFADGSALGDDESGNANDFTASGLAATDVVPDSPTNNFGTMNPLDKNSMNFSEGNLRPTPSADYRAVRGAFGIPTSGKWYFEARVITGGGGNIQDQQIGITTASNVLSGSSPYPQAFTYGVGYFGSGKINRAGSTAQSSLTALTAGDILGVAVNVDDDEVQFYLDGSAEGTTEQLVSTTEPNFAFFVGATNRSSQFNFGQDSTFSGAITAGGNTDANGNGDFAYAPPSGHLALCTANLSDPTIDPLLDQTPEDYFNTVLYTSNNIGSGGTQSVTGVGFQPDWCWIKNRTSNSTSHTSYTSVQGAGEMLSPNGTGAEDTNSQYGYLSSFDSDGFTLTGGSTNANYINQSTDNYVSWNWLAGGTASNNTDGSIDSSVSANTKAGFSIVKYTGDGTATTIGHGLDSAPEMYIVKNISSADNWVVYHKDLTSASYYLTLDTTNAEVSNNVVFNGTDPTSTVFSVGTSRSTNGDNYIAYCFHSVEGYSKMGTYEGNASNDGAFVFCGFRPAFLMVKTIDKTGGWHIFDNLRAFTGNEIDVRLEADNSDAENTSGPPHMDLLSNGFKLRSSFDNINPSSTIVFMAFAEQPFKYSNAR